MPSQIYAEIFVSLLSDWAETIIVLEPGNILASSLKSQWKWPGWGRSELPCLSSNPDPDDRKKTKIICAFHCFLFCFCMVLEIRSPSVARLMKVTVTETPFPRYHPWFLSPSITLPLLFPSHSSAHLLPQDHQASSYFKKTSCLCWSIDPHSCFSIASVWAGLCEIGLLIRWCWVAEM